MIQRIKKPLSVLLSLILILSMFTVIPMTSASAATKYTISYHLNGADGIEKSNSYDIGNTVSADRIDNFIIYSAPAGYYFLNWNTKADGTGTSYRPIYDDLPQTDTDLYAQWALSYSEKLFYPWYFTDRLPDTEGKYYLRNDVTLSGSWNVPAGEYYLCLNGHSVTLQNTYECVIHIANEDTVLNLYDQDNTGIITGGDNDLLNAKDGGGVAISAAATFNMYGGKIYNNKSRSGGGGVAISDSSAVFNMYGGIIDGNQSLGAGAGGVRVFRGTFNMYDGTISNNTARDNGGGVNVDGGNDQVFNMHGGSITGNTAENYGGGGVGIDGGGTFTMTGGSITGNTADYNGNSRRGGGVMFNSYATFNLSGSAVISGNNYYGMSNDVCMANGQFINVNGAFTADANIGVSKIGSVVSGKFTSGYAANNSGRDPSDDFFCNDAAYLVTLKDNEASLSKCNVTWKNYDGSTIKTSECSRGYAPYFTGNLPVKASDSSNGYVFAGWTPTIGTIYSDATYTATYTAVEKHEHDGINFTYWNSTAGLPSTAGNYVLNDDVTISSTWTVPTGTTKLCLNGHKIRRTGTGGVIKNENADTTLEIFDCDTTGTITGGFYDSSEANRGKYGAGIEFLSGHLILNGGTISGNRLQAIGTGGGGVKLDDGNTGDGKTPTFVMNGGTISGNSAAYGGGVYVRRGVFTFNGGTISGNTAHTTDGGGIHIYGTEATLNMNGGTISGNNSKCGGGIGVSGGGNINITGGTIQNNNASTAGGGLCNQRGAADASSQAASISISGDTVITGNTVGGSATSNIYLINDVKLAAGQLGDNAQMGVSLGTGTGVFTTGYSADNTSDPTRFFFSDNSGYGVGFTGSEARLTAVHRITWKNYDDSVITVQDVGDGAVPYYSDETPTKPADDHYTYTFSGWSPAVSAATADAAYTATFEAHEKKLFAGHSLTLNGDVGVNFFLDMKKIGLTNDDIISGGKTITVTVDWAEGCDAKKPIDNSFTVSGSNYEDYLDQDDDSDTKGMFRVTCDVASAEMTCLIHVTATVTGDVNTYTDDYCVRDYCEYIIENSSDADLIALVKATLDYGATSQTAFDVNVDDLADEKLNGSDSRYAYDRCTVDAASIDEAIGAANPGKTASDMSKVAEDINAYWYTASVIFLSKNTLRHYFYRNDGTLGTVSGFDGVAQDYFYYAEKTDIAAAELDTLQSFTVGGVTFEYSALDYVKAVLASDTMEQKYLDLAAALFRYNQAANGYFDRT